MAPPVQAKNGPPKTLDCASMPCKQILPGAVTFKREKQLPFSIGLDASGHRVGWVFLSTEVVNIPAYSGKPLVTLIGLDLKGVITGVRVIHHAEPILLVGIPEAKLHRFAKFYVGKNATTRVVVGTAAGNQLQVDVISGATVTVLALNKTILEAARKVGVSVGVINISATNPGYFVKGKRPLTWQQMHDQRIFGRLTVTEKQMGIDSPDDFVDLWFTIADAPQIGRALLGDRTYKYLMKKLKPGQHLFVVLGSGSASFKGSAFVRGGIFDRVRFEQGIRELVFRDTDYKNISRIPAVGAPYFKEGAVFISRSAQIDPGTAFKLVFLGSKYSGKSAFHRDFREFSSSHRLPRSVYVVTGTQDERIFVQAWRNNRVDVTILIVYLLLVTGVFVARRFTTAKMKRLNILHISSMVFAVVMVGFYMKAQPSVTQLLTLVGSLIHEPRWELFLSGPLLFVLWIQIAIVSVIWGRGVFCGWVCPYGALTELLHKFGKLLRLPSFELPSGIHRWAKYLRYLVVLSLVPIFLWNPLVGEQLAEIEPFKSTFFVYAWNRHWGFFAWWGFLIGISLVWWRPFCRYLCPLGGALAIYGSFRFSGPLRREFCTSCKICTTRCEPLAIRPDGTIDPRECLSCMECEANYRDDDVCPPLVGLKKLRMVDELTPTQQKRNARLIEQRRDV